MALVTREGVEEIGVWVGVLLMAEEDEGMRV